MDSPEDLDRLLSLGSERPAVVEACVAQPPIDPARLRGYRRDTLSSAAREDLERHLCDCPYCRDRVAEIRSAPPRRWGRAVGAVAVGAALLILFLRPPHSEPVGSYVLVGSVEGARAALRGDAAVTSGLFLPTSQVAIKIEPAQGRPAAAVAVFRVENGALIPIPAAVDAGVEGVFLLKGSGRTFFGIGSGPKRLLIVAAPAALDLSTLAGRGPAEARSLTASASWLPPVDVRYQDD